ncbi:hypothetical protein P5G86_23935 [Paenibacillus jamilae]|uniref:hypothetical protein n=1 Tax=Bacillus cereus group TaxID=86661 RepID=UPI00129896E3|nr:MULTISPECIES: hypothetical protein [Bacillus cereus group]MEB4843043.1 hypothetical protein [Paenibacillus jamilae]MEB8830960.1 hypothetical protein [Bacillus cereus]MCR6856550.1 hypothetical protein [Bacillus thuringiensis]MDO6631616.1 hypothetical protein [Bacillus thuringiensis]MDO6661256.1 hypothetical protein [Bacillus thuringiensis]
MSAADKRFGVYVQGVLIDSYDDIMNAYEIAEFSTKATNIPHEVRIISKNKVIDLLRQIREKRVIIKPIELPPQAVRLDEFLEEICYLINCNDEEGQYSLQVFTDREKNRDGECFVGISYGIKLMKNEEVKWKQIIIRGHDSALASDLANFHRAMLLQVCNAIALYFQQGIYKWKDIKCKIIYDFKVFNNEAFKYDSSDSFVKHRVFDKEYRDKIANTLSGWR